ncbi:MAG: nuclear transport factor 2 family protein [Candidatus Acidiferrales bacterium]
MTDDGHSAESRNKQIIQSGFDKSVAGTGGIFDLLTDDATWTIVGNSPMSRTYNSKKELIDEVIAPFGARMSKRFVPTVRGLYADGDMVIAFFDGRGTALDGKSYENTYTWYMRMKDEKIVDVVAFFDIIEFTDLWTRVAPARSAAQ